MNKEIKGLSDFARQNQASVLSTLMAHKHSKLWTDARVAGLSDDELDLLAYELQQDPDAETTDEEDTLYNNSPDLDLDDDAQNSSKTSDGLSVPQTSYNGSAPGKRKRKSAKFVQDETRECHGTAFTYFII
jgi:hypothetical protein